MPILLTDDCGFASRHLGIRSGFHRIPPPPAFARLAWMLSVGATRPLEFHRVLDIGASDPFTEWDLVVSARSVDGSQFDHLIQWRREETTSRPWRVACFAESGTGFHGQRDRVWRALLGNIHFSCLLPIDADLSRIQAALSAAPAVATIRALKGQLPAARPTIKWVNDIQIHRQKVAGSLIQTISRLDRSLDLFLGIGVNVKRAPIVEPTPFCPSVTCLVDASRQDVSLSATVRGLALESVLIGKRLESDPMGLVQEYQDHANLVGHQACLWPSGTRDWRSVEPFARGRIIGIDDQLRLLLNTESEPISTGRLALDIDAFPKRRDD